MKWLFKSAGVAGALSAAILILSYTTDVVPEPATTADVEPEQLEHELKEVGDEANEAVDMLMPDAVAKKDGINLE